MQKTATVGNYKIKLSTIAESEPVQFTGDVLVSDPCYYIPSDLWQELCNMWFDSGRSNAFTDKGILEINDIKILYSSTAHGDGCYSVHNVGNYVGEIGVDAGMFSFILAEDAAKLTNEDLSKIGVVLQNFNGDVYVDGNGNADGYITVCTDDSDEEEMDDYWLDEEDNEW